MSTHPRALPFASRTLLAAFALLLPQAVAQQSPTPPSFTMAVPRTPNPPNTFTVHMPGDPGSSTLNIVPPGTWWRNPETVKALALTPGQSKRMDEIFRKNKIDLIRLKASLDEEQLNLDALLDANPPDSAKALAEIGKIADLRAGLEKANARMLLDLRAVLAAGQWTRLQAIHHDSPSSFSFPSYSFKIPKDVTTTTVTITTCTKINPQSTPRCTTTHSSLPGRSALMPNILTMPRGDNAPPRSFTMEIPDPPSL